MEILTSKYYIDSIDNIRDGTMISHKHTKKGAILGSIGTALSSLLACAWCPMCLPIYAGILGYFGIEIVGLDVYFLPATLLFMAVTIYLMIRYAKHRGTTMQPSVLAFAAALALLGSISMESEWMIYASIAIFMGAIIWNKTTSPCSGCECKDHEH